ncbi:MAG: KamA family radical SAM protein, partial [Verrucomicrobia bacterium]|nr:KamA family radical SAM protein [Verrucomicrobiota bacterium]
VYAHDMVPGCEHLRTTIATAERLSKDIQGTTAGFNLPKFVCDAPGGGGKREISSYDYYDSQLGISAWTAPRVRPDHVFFYYDPIDQLSLEGQRFWNQVRQNPDALGHLQEKIRSEVFGSQKR